MPTDEATWAAIRRAYDETTEPIATILRRFNVHSSRFYEYRLRHGWPPRPQSALTPKRKAAPSAKAKAAAGSKPAQPKPSATPTSAAAARYPARLVPLARYTRSRAARAQLLGRLYAAIDLKLQQMEQHLAMNIKTTPADHERETRTLGTLIKTFENATEINPDQAGPAPAHAASAGGTSSPAGLAAGAFDPSNAVRLRREIAERLERIEAKRNAARDAP
jgi:hypothetical protein